MNSETYTELLDIALVSHAEDLMGPNFTFQQDNAAIHVSRRSMEWFEEKNIPLLGWPACSPDLNPIENLWGWLARKVYANGRQFETVSELKEAIREAWSQIQINYLRELVKSMKDRLIGVIMAKGGPTKH